MFLWILFSKLFYRQGFQETRYKKGCKFFTPQNKIIFQPLKPQIGFRFKVSRLMKKPLLWNNWNTFFPQKTSRSIDLLQFANTTKSHQVLSRKPGNIVNDSKTAFPSFVEHQCSLFMSLKFTFNFTKQLQLVKVAKTTKDNGWQKISMALSSLG